MKSLFEMTLEELRTDLRRIQIDRRYTTDNAYLARLHGREKLVRKLIERKEANHASEGN